MELWARSHLLLPSELRHIRLLAVHTTTCDSSLQETFDAGLQAFQQEGIANITALKDQLLAAKHIQSKAIEVRHASLMKRWTQLLANSATRKKKLLEAQSHFRKVRVVIFHWTSGRDDRAHFPLQPMPSCEEGVPSALRS